MEFVKGLPVTEYCDGHKLDIEERLKLFAQVCDAIHYAHQKGIIHRDVKPTNILVSIEGDQVIPKVIDFGVAKAISQTLTERSFFTEYGQIIGTPEYMSPEQADIAAWDIDIRSDIYSLGVLLYELLTGVLPFDLKTLREAAFGEIQRIIREEDPPSPSTKLSSLGEAAKAIAQKRRTEVGSLSKKLHRELEWIPLKAMRKDRRERYRSASELADDIGNYLQGSPLIAGPETAAYQIKKFVRKNRALVTGITSVLIVLIAGIIITTIFAKREFQARNEAERQTYIAQIRLVQAYMADNNYEQANNTLWETRESLRHWEWGYLLNLCNLELYIFPDQREAAYSPDGKYVVTSSQNGTLSLWDAYDGSLIRTMPGQMRSGITPTFNPEGKQIITGSQDGIVEIRNVESGTIVGALPSQQGIVSAVAFSPDQSYIVTGSHNKELHIWDAQTYALIIDFDDYNAAILTVMFSPDGSKILAYCFDDVTQASTIDIREISIEKVQNISIEGKGYRVITADRLSLQGESPVFSPDGRLLLWVNGVRANITDLETGQQRASWIAHKGKVSIACFSPDGNRIVTGSSNGMAKVWNVEEVIAERPIELTLDHGEPVIVTDFSPDGELMLTASSNGLLKVWETGTGYEISVFNGHVFGVHTAAFSPDSRYIVTAAADQTVRVWDAYYSPGRSALIHSTARLDTMSVVADRTGTVETRVAVLSSHSPGRQIDILNLEQNSQLVSFAGYAGSVSRGGVSLSSDGKRIAATLDEFTPVVIDLASQSVQAIFRGHQGKICSVNFSPDNLKILSTSHDRTARIWDSSSGKELLVLQGHEDIVRWGAFSPDGNHIVTASDDKKVIVWNSDTDDIIHVLEAHTGCVSHVGFSYDGTKIVTSSADNTAMIWNAQNGKLELKLEGHSDSVYFGSFSPDDNRVVTSSKDGTCKVWDALTGEELAILRGHLQEVTSSFFVDGGSSILSTSFDGCLRKWEAAPWRVAELPGDDSLEEAERFDLLRKQATPARPIEAFRRFPTTLVIITGKNIFLDCMERFRGTLQSDIAVEQPFQDLLILNKSMRNALARLCFYEGIGARKITDYGVAVQAVEDLLKQIRAREQPEMTIQIQRQEQMLTVKFIFIPPSSMIEREVSLPREELLAFFQTQRNEIDEKRTFILDINQTRAQDRGESILEPNGLNGLWVPYLLEAAEKQHLFQLGLAFDDRMVQINDQPITSIAGLGAIYDDIIQSLRTNDEYAFSLKIEQGEFQTLLLTIKTR